MAYRISKRAAGPVRVGIAVLAALALGTSLASPLAAQQKGLPKEGQALPPPPIVDPEVAIKDPIANDAIFWWRYDTFRTRGLEPPEEFYWPDAPIAGDPQPFFPAVDPAKATISAQALAQMEDWAVANKTRALVVLRHGKIEYENYWDGIAPDQITNARAITRGFTPMLLGFAVADGTVDLDAPIEVWVPEWKGDPRGAVTLRQLATNSAGFERDGVTGSVYGNKQVRIFYASDVVSALLDMNLVAEPGSRFDVTEINTQLISMILERAVGKPLNQQLSERVWKPIGASRANFQLDRPGGNVHALCCMRATPRDLVRVGQLLLQNGTWKGKQLLPEGWVETMATPSAANPNFGHGFWLGSPYVAKRSYSQGKPGSVPQSEPFLAKDVRFFEGGGYRELYIVPSQDMVILRLGYSSPTWDNAYLVNTAIRGMKD